MSFESHLKGGLAQGPSLWNLPFFTALAASSNLGAVFGFLHARPYWEGAYTGVFHPDGAPFGSSGPDHPLLPD